MRWRRVLCVTSLGISFFSANAESQTGTVSGEAPDAVVHFNNKTDSSYSMHAQSSGGWVFTEDFSWGGPNGWYSDAKYSIACERIPLVETAFVDASLCFGASMNGSMYKPGGEGGSPIPWSVSSAFHTAPQPYIYPAESIFAKGEPQALRYIVDNVMTSAPGGFWKYNGVTVTGSSVQTDWQNIGSSYTLPSTLDAGLYTVNAARNSAGAFSASAWVKIVSVESLTVGSATKMSDEEVPVYYIKRGEQGQKITITANAAPGTPWPENGNTKYPQWTGGNGQVSEQASDQYLLPIDEANDFTITASCGTSSKSVRVVVIGLDIKRNGQIISGKNDGGDRIITETIVGKKINLTGEVKPAGIHLKSKQWAIPGKRIKNYIANNQEGKIVELSSGNLRDTSVEYYWIDALNGNVDYSVTVSYNNKEFELNSSAGFNVKCPTTGLIVRLGKTIADNANSEMKFGDSNRAGLSGALQISDTDRNMGNFTYCQLLSLDLERFKNNTLAGKISTNKAIVLDTFFPYGGHQAKPTISDTPSVLLEENYDKYTVLMAFKTWLIFKPTGSDSIWIPLRHFAWEWRATAEKDSNNDWHVTQRGGSEEQSVSDQPTTDHPTWSANVVTYKVWK